MDIRPEPAVRPPVARALDPYEPPVLSRLGTIDELTFGGAEPITDMTAGASL